MKIHPVKQNGNRYCGPAAISALTGVGTKEAAALIREANGITRPVKWTTTREITITLSHLGFEAPQVFSAAREKRKPTLAGWLKETPRPAGDVFLVAYGGHWGVVSGRRYVCSQTQEIVSVRDKRIKRRARVLAAWRVSK
jgi:hypothetical protein